MLDLKKITIGIRPAQRMFRVSSFIGAVIDEVLSKRGVGLIGAEYYSEVTKSQEQAFVQLRGQDGANFLRIDQDGIVFCRAAYDAAGSGISIDNCFAEFHSIWKAINDVLIVRNIRRIGLVGEHRISMPESEVNKRLMSAVTTFEPPAHPHKLHLRFENRSFITSKTGIPDLKSDDLLNVISDFYDSSMDGDFPTSEGINFNLDVQRYYNPFFNGGLQNELIFLKKKLEDEQKRNEGLLKERGIVE